MSKSWLHRSLFTVPPAAQDVLKGAGTVALVMLVLFGVATIAIEYRQTALAWAGIALATTWRVLTAIGIVPVLLVLIWLAILGTNAAIRSLHRTILRQGRDD